jgi:hypothetical protein
MTPPGQELRPIPISCNSVTLGKVLLALLVIWLAFAVIGIVVHALFWLFVIGLILFLITAVTSGRHSGFLRR